MKIEFSPKYKPLFKILSAREELKDNPGNEYLKQLTQIDTVVIYGGRESSKTYPISTFVPLAAKDYNHRILYTRYSMNSTDQSINQALENRMEILGCSGDFEYSNHVYQHKTSLGRIFITGQKTSSLNQTAKLKSLEDFSIFITDEAEEIKSYDEWDKIRKSIRAKDVQCLSILVFNPPTREHWLYTELFEDLGVSEGFTGIKDNILYIHMTYLDNIEHIAEHNLREFEKLRMDYELYYGTKQEDREELGQKVKKNAKKYKHIVLGGFQDSAEGVIYEDWEIGEFPDNLPYCYGLDFGFNDPDALTRIAVDRRASKIYVDEILYTNGLGSIKLGEALLNLVGRTDLIVADAADSRLINDLYYMGLNIRRCKKRNSTKQGSLKRTIKIIQSYQIVVTKDSKNVIKSLKNYAWHESKSGIPRHEYSHILDSMRYGAIEQIEY